MLLMLLLIVYESLKHFFKTNFIVLFLLSFSFVNKGLNLLAVRPLLAVEAGSLDNPAAWKCIGMALFPTRLSNILCTALSIPPLVTSGMCFTLNRELLCSPG